jgi:hypothetical protein
MQGINSQIPQGWIDVSGSGVTLAKPGIGIMCNGTAGQVDFTDALGNTHSWPIAIGQVIHTQVVKIAGTSTATGLSVGYTQI